MNYINYGRGFSLGELLPAFTLVVLWSLFWKGLALWHASKRDEKGWYVVLLVVNTLGILELVYLFYFVKVKLNKLW